MPNAIPRPLVRANQSFMVSTILLAAIARSPWILAVTLLVGLAGLIWGPKGNLVMRVVKPIISRRINLKEAAQEDGEEQRFNQTIAVALLALSLLSFFVLRSALWGWIFAGMVFIAATVALLGFCVGCWLLLQIRMYKHRRALHL